SGAAWLGRFCHADPNLHRFVGEHVRDEEALQPDTLFAEVVHLPEGRVGNILSRPVLRGYEIPYLGDSGAPPDRQIPVTDLVLSVRHGRLVLRSASLDREVVPRLTSAHGFSRESLGVYRFLCALQHQGIAARLFLDWGVLRSSPFLPRVTAGRLILSLARWRIEKEELQRFDEAHGTELFREIQRWRSYRRLPRWVALADGDNTLPVDLDNVLSVEAFVSIVKQRQEATLVELFPEPSELLARGP